jgi:aspartate-semialdehyde dehydrogenase
MTKPISLAIVGATGLVGAAVLELLSAREFPLHQLYLLASQESVGTPVEFAGKSHRVKDLASFDFRQVQLAIFCVPASVAAQYVPIAQAAGCTVIDHSEQFRLAEYVPLVIPEINPHLLETCRPGDVIACPDSATTQMLLAVYPIYQAVGVKRIDVTTCLAVSAIGKVGIDELSKQTIALLNLKKLQAKYFSQQITFNLLPQHAESAAENLSRQESLFVKETQKILEDPDICICPWHVQAPVFFGHSQTLTIETKGNITVDAACGLFDGIPAMVRDDPFNGELPTAVTHAASHEEVYLGRIRSLPEPLQGVGIWLVADNIRRGAAMGSVQIAEILVKGYL